MRCKEATGQAGDAIVEAEQPSIATRGRSSYPVSRYPSPRLATLLLTHTAHAPYEDPSLHDSSTFLRIGLITVSFSLHVYISISLAILSLSLAA